MSDNGPIPFFTNRTVFSRAAHNYLVQKVNAITRTRVIKTGPGGPNNFNVSEENATLEISDPQSIAAAVASSTFYHPFSAYQVSNLVYQVRGGYIGMRSKNGQFNAPGMTNKPFGGNGETNVQIFSGADGVVDDLHENNYWTSSQTPATGVTVEAISVGNSGDFGVSTPGDAAQFTLNAATDGDGGIRAGVWAELTEGSPPTGTIKMRMWAANAGTTGRTTAAFPNAYGDAVGSPATLNYTIPSKIIVPIAVIVPRNTVLPVPTDLVVEQLVDDHVIRRYPAGIINSSSSGGHLGPMRFRGLVSFGPFSDPEGLNNTYFYDGDVLAVHETVSANPVTSLWIHIGIDLESSSFPSINGGSGLNWRLLAGPA